MILALLVCQSNDVELKSRWSESIYQNWQLRLSVVIPNATGYNAPDGRHMQVGEEEEEEGEGGWKKAFILSTEGTPE